jgi:signal transduction histidine kinase
VKSAPAYVSLSTNMRSVATQPKPLAAALPANEGPANEGSASAAARLDALHRASGALTHDFNNLLGVILSASERLAGELAAGGEQQKLALLTLEAAERGAELLRRTLSLGHDAETPAATALDANVSIATVRRMARQAIPANVRLRATGAAEPLSCQADRTGLEMALLNLCLNAGQAMCAGGSLFLSARMAHISGFDARRMGLEPGDYVGFTVRDTGPGMSPETLARATEPLFTTKATGTGLGLSSVRDFAASCAGALSLWSREGQGTSATLYVPAAA